MNRIPTLLTICVLCLVSCSKKDAPQNAETTPQYAPQEASPASGHTADADETAAAALLDTARIALQAGGFDTARSKARSVKLRFPHALNAREDAILLLDSIEIFEAAAKVARLDATGHVEADEAIAVERAKAADKVEFFQQKLARDIAARKRH